MTTAAVLRAIVTADTAAAEKKLAGVGKQLESLGSAGSKNLAALGVSGTTAFAAVGVAAVVGIGKAVDSTVELATEVRQLSQQLGVTAEDASKLRFAGEELGVSFGSLSRGFGIFEKSLKEGGSAFKQYGITIDETLSPQEQFNDVLGQAADKYKELGGGIKGAQLALTLFGRGGRDLIPLLRQGADGIKRLSDEAEKYGVVLSEKDVKAVFDFQIAQRQLSAAMQGFEIQVGTRVIPVLTQLVGVVTSVVTAFDNASIHIGHFQLSLLDIAAHNPGLVDGLTGLGELPPMIGQNFEAMGEAALSALSDTNQAILGTDAKLKEFAIVTQVTASSFADALHMTQAELITWQSGVASAINFVDSKLQTLAGQAHTSAHGIVKAFDNALKAQIHYGDNLDALVKAGFPAALLKQLTDLGVGGAGVIASLAHANHAQQAKIIADFLKTQREAHDTASSIDEIYAAAQRAAGTYTLTFDINTRGRIPGGGGQRFAAGGETAADGGMRSPVYEVSRPTQILPGVTAGEAGRETVLPQNDRGHSWVVNAVKDGLMEAVAQLTHVLGGAGGPIIVQFDFDAFTSGLKNHQSRRGAWS